MDTHRHPARRIAAVAGIVLGLAAGSYGVASAASGSGSSGSAAATGSVRSQSLAQNAAQAAPGQQAPNASNPWGAQPSDEPLLTGDATKVEAAALAKVPGGTIVRVETDADGHAAYEAHMTKQDGTPVTVYVDKQYQVVSVESR